MKKFIEENWFKLGMLFLLGIIVISAVSYFFYILPNNEREQQQAVLAKEQAQQAAAVAEEQEQQAKQEYNKTQLNDCLNNAKIGMEKGLTSAGCQTNNDAYNYCINGGLSDSQCKSLANINSDGTISPGNCRIPQTTVDDLEELYKESQDNCFKQFPQN